jgi:hypothetical protein
MAYCWGELDNFAMMRALLSKASACWSAVDLTSSAGMGRAKSNPLGRTATDVVGKKYVHICCICVVLDAHILHIFMDRENVADCVIEINMIRTCAYRCPGDLDVPKGFARQAPSPTQSTWTKTVDHKECLVTHRLPTEKALRIGQVLIAAYYVDRLGEEGRRGVSRSSMSTAARVDVKREFKNFSQIHHAMEVMKSIKLELEEQGSNLLTLKDVLGALGVSQLW